MQTVANQPRTLQTALIDWATDQSPENTDAAATLVSRVISEARAGARRIECAYDGLPPDLFEEFSIEVVAVGGPGADEPKPPLPLTSPPQLSRSEASGSTGLDWLDEFTRLGFPVLGYLDLADMLELSGQTKTIDARIESLLHQLETSAPATHAGPHISTGVSAARALFESKKRLRELTSELNNVTTESARAFLDHGVKEVEAKRERALSRFNACTKQIWFPSGVREMFGGAIEIEVVTGTYSTQTNTVYSFTGETRHALARHLGCSVEDVGEKLNERQDDLEKFILSSGQKFTRTSSTYYESMWAD